MTILKAKNKLVIRSIEIIKEAKNGEQQKDIEMKGIILVKVDEM